MRTWAERNRGPGLTDVLATAMALRRSRQQEQQQQQQQEQNAWQFERAKAEDERQQDFRTLLGGPNPEEARLADALQYDKWQQAQAAAQMDARKNALDMQKQGLEMQKLEREGVDSTEKNTLDLQQRLLSAAKAGADIGNLRRIRDEAVARKRVRPFQLPGDGDAFAELTDTPQEREQQITQLQRQAGVAEPAEPTSVQEYKFAQKDPGYRQDQIDLARAKASVTNVNVGDHPLPANQISEIADFNTAIDTLSGLAKDFKKLVPADDVAAQMRARGEALIPNSKVDQYNAMVLRAQQIVGLILENGKLVGQDEAKYRRMLPAPGDSYEMVQMKISGLMRDLEIKGRNRAEAYSQGGYRVPKVRSAPQQDSGQAQPSQADAIARRAAELRAANVPQDRALEIMRQEGYDLGGQQ